MHTSFISGRKFWGFPLFAGDCASGHKSMLDQKYDISEQCDQMMKKLDAYHKDKVWSWSYCLFRCLNNLSCLIIAISVDKCED
jgi:hypothetical protein